MKKIGIFYGSSTGTTESVAHTSAQKLGVASNDVHDASKLTGEMVKEYVEKRKNDVDGFILTCKDHLIPFYESCGFKFVKVSASTHGNAKWNDMVIDCRGEI